jgi:hypothetical protein
VLVLEERRTLLTAAQSFKDSQIFIKMPLLSPSGKHLSLHQLMAMSTMMSLPAHSKHVQLLIPTGGGEGTSDVAAHQLYLSQPIQDHLRRVYDTLCDREPRLTYENFVSWLESTQGQLMEVPHKESYLFEEFLAVLYYNDGFEAVKEAMPKDLSKPISNYFISSSHNTYLSGNQLSSKSSVDSYKTVSSIAEYLSSSVSNNCIYQVLLGGCRCIEIDVWDGDAAEPIASDVSNLSTSPKPEHKRHLSATNLPSLAAEAAGKLSATYKSVKDAVKDRKGLGIHLLGMEKGNKSSESLAEGDLIERPPSTKPIRNGEPIVLHGWTLTAPVGFRDVCKTIRETAFQTSELPIIVSLEVHANLEQQQIMVDIMKEEWKGILIDVAHETCNPDERVPRLDELLGKILVKVKKSTSPTPEVLSTSTLGPLHYRNPSNNSLGPSSKPFSSSSNSLAPVNSRHEGDSCSGSEDERSSKKKTKICEALSNLGIYTHSEHFIDFTAKNCMKPSHIFSISENQILELHEKKREEMFAHNRDYFMRAYPAGFRFDSSNLDPSLFWRKGVQMVALNWQNIDEGMMLNEAMFAGEKGWVLKPPGYRSDTSETIAYKTLHLKITIYAGQNIPIPQNQEHGFHPYVRCELHVEKPDESKTVEMIEGNGRAKGGEYKQKTPYGKGDHPVFGNDGILLDFPVVTGVLEELSFVRLVSLCSICSLLFI